MLLFLIVYDLAGISQRSNVRVHGTRLKPKCQLALSVKS